MPTVQYSSDSNAWISFSRSQMSLTVTDCTRPAERPLRIAVADELDRDRLYAAGREALANFAPEERTQLVADNAVEHAARLLRVDAIHVDGARLLDSGLDGRLRDFVEDDAAVRRRVDAEDVGEMPCDGLALAVRVACEVDFRSVLRIFLERLDEVALATDVDVFRREVVVDVDAELALRQVAQVAHRCANHVLAAEVFLDGLGLGWRLDDDERLLRRRPFLRCLFRGLFHRFLDFLLSFLL